MNFSVALEDNDVNNFLSDIDNVSLEDITDNDLFNAFRGIKIANQDMHALKRISACMESYDGTALDKYTKSMYNVIISNYKQQYNIDTISIENAEYKTDKQIAMESIGSVLKSIWEAIKRVFTRMYQAIKKFFIGEKQDELRIEKKLQETIEKAKKIERKHKGKRQVKVSKLFTDYKNRKLKSDKNNEVTEVVKSNSNGIDVEEVMTIDYSDYQINPEDLERFRYFNNNLDLTYITGYISRLSNYNHLIVQLNRVLNANVDNMDGVIETFGKQKHTMSLDENVKWLYDATCNRMVTFRYELTMACQEVPVLTEDLKFIPEPRRGSAISTMPYFNDGEMIYIYGQDDEEEKNNPYYIAFLFDTTNTTSPTDKVTAPLLNVDEILNIGKNTLQLQNTVEKNADDLSASNKLCDILKDRIDKVKLYDTEGNQNPETLEILNKTLGNISQFYKTFYYYFQNSAKLNSKLKSAIVNIQILMQISLYHHEQIDSFIVE